MKNFKPNWVSKPGDTISDILNEKNISISLFATLMQTTPAYINDLLNGYIKLTNELSLKLEKTLGPSTHFWLTREAVYRESLERLQVQEKKWLKELPLKEMISWGWLNNDITNKYEAALQYFDVSSVSAWRHKYELEMRMVNFRTSSTFKSQPASISAWLRQGEIQIDSIESKPWNATLFRKQLINIKKLTRVKDPTDFIPSLIKLCAECGVAVAIVRTPMGCRASGVTKFISNERALLMLSFRYLTDDHFWFTFFHEAAHLLLHGNKSVFVEEMGKDKMISKEEIEANNFAADQLISADHKAQLMRIPYTNKKAVIGFASQVGVSPGIVIGQLQHLGRIPFNRMNSYKRRYSWDNIKINH